MFTQIVAQNSTIAQAARRFAANYPELAHKCNGRIERAQSIATAGYVFIASDRRMAYVLSPASDCTFQVGRGIFGQWSACDCPDNAKRANTCQHILAAEFAEQARALELRALIDQAED